MPLVQSAPLERIPFAAFAEHSYLNYSMYVIMDRALPALADVPSLIISLALSIALLKNEYANSSTGKRGDPS